MIVKTKMQCTHVDKTADGHEAAGFNGGFHKAELAHEDGSKAKEGTPINIHLVITDPELKGKIVAGRTYGVAVELTEA